MTVCPTAVLADVTSGRMFTVVTLSNVTSIQLLHVPCMTACPTAVTPGNVSSVTGCSTVVVLDNFTSLTGYLVY